MEKIIVAKVISELNSISRLNPMIPWKETDSASDLKHGKDNGFQGD